MRGPSAIQERIDLIPEREACLPLVGRQEFEGSPLAQSGQRGVRPPGHQLRNQRSVRCSAVPNPPVPRGQIGAATLVPGRASGVVLPHSSPEHQRRLPYPPAPQNTLRCLFEALLIVHWLSRPGEGHRIDPNLLRGVTVKRPNQLWAADITFMPMASSFISPDPVHLQRPHRASVASISSRTDDSS